MDHQPIVRTSDGAPFQDGPDHGRVLVFGRETEGRYGLMEFVVAARDLPAPGQAPDFGPHRHRAIEETFLVRRGRLRFLLGDESFDLTAGDFVRAPPGVRHGYANLSGEPVELLVSFHPGGFEELFVKHRSDQHPAPVADGFMRDAVRLFDSEFEAPP